jgi:hypothetical protein
MAAQGIERAPAALYHHAHARLPRGRGTIGGPLRRLLAVCFLLLMPHQAFAFIQTHVIAPNFTKNQLVGGAAGGSWSLWSQAPDVVVLFVLGYS